MKNVASNGLNPVLLAIMANRMDAICREMTNTVLFSARSAVIGIARDFSCAIITAEDEVLAVAEAMPIHVFGMHLQTASMKKYHPNFCEGDAPKQRFPSLALVRQSSREQRPYLNRNAIF